MDGGLCGCEAGCAREGSAPWGPLSCLKFDPSFDGVGAVPFYPVLDVGAASFPQVNSPPSLLWGDCLASSSAPLLSVWGQFPSPQSSMWGQLPSPKLIPLLLFKGPPFIGAVRWHLVYLRDWKGTSRAIARKNGVRVY
jgi:hypothetical protein